MKGLNYAVLCYRLYLIYYIYNYFGIIKIDFIIYFWFKKAYRLLILSNFLKLYKFIYNLVLKFFYN